MKDLVKKNNVAIPSGYTIRDEMEVLGMSNKKMSTMLDIPEDELDNILNGRSKITEEIAIKLEKILGMSKEFLLRLDKNYIKNLNDLVVDTLC